MRPLWTVLESKTRDGLTVTLYDRSDYDGLYRVTALKWGSGVLPLARKFKTLTEAVGYYKQQLEA